MTPPAPAPTLGARPARAGVAHGTVRALDAVGSLILRLIGPDAPWTTGSRTVHAVLGWLVTRAVVVVMLLRWEHVVGLDIDHYSAGLDAGSGGSFDAVLREYPVPAAALVAIPRALAGGPGPSYTFWFVALILAVDAAFTALLHRSDADGRAVTMWLAVGPMVGPLLVTRFDLVTGAALAVAVLLLSTRPRVSAVLAVVAASIKLWPILVLPALAAPRRGRRTVVVTSVVAAAAVVVLCLLLGDLDRSLAPLRFQSDRGLQIESLPALPLMALWSVAHAPWTVGLSAFSCDEVSGPGSAVMLGIAGLAGFGVLVVAGVLSSRLWRRSTEAPGAAVGWVSLALVGLLVVTNKVFSPQYLLWLVPLAVVLMILTADPLATRITVALMLVGALGQVIYPFAYSWVDVAGSANSAGVALLALRMGALAVVVGVAVARAFRETGAPVPAPV